MHAYQYLFFINYELNEYFGEKPPGSLLITGKIPTTFTLDHQECERRSKGMNTKSENKFVYAVVLFEDKAWVGLIDTMQCAFLLGHDQVSTLFLG